MSPRWLILPLVLMAIWAAQALSQQPPPTPDPPGERDPERTTDEGPLRLAPLRGKGELRAPGEARAKTLATVQEVDSGARISAKGGGAAFDLSGGGLGGTALLFLQDGELLLEEDAQGRVALKLDHGRMFLDDHDERIALSISSGTSTIDLVGTGVAVAQGSKGTHIYVERGKVAVQTGATRMIVDTDRQLSIDATGAVGPVIVGGGDASAWRWDIDRGKRVALRYGLAKCNVPELAERVVLPGGVSALKAVIPDDRWVKFNYDGFAVRPGRSYNFVIKARIEKGQASSDLFIFRAADVYDFGGLKRAGPLWEGWQTYRLSGRMPAGLDPEQTVNPRLSVQGPATIWVGEAYWEEYQEQGEVAFLDGFGSPGSIRAPRWHTLSGDWRHEQGVLSGQAPAGGTGLLLAAQEAPSADFHFGGRVQPGSAGEAGLVLGLRDDRHYHVIWMRGGERPRLQLVRVSGDDGTVLAERYFESQGFATSMLEAEVHPDRIDVHLAGRRVLRGVFKSAGQGLGVAVRGTGPQTLDNLLLR